MARPRRRSGIQVSLFPFLSILACVIGSLTLLIAGLTAGQIGQSKLAGRREHADLARNVAHAQGEATDLQKLVEEALQVRQALKEAQAELARFQGRQAQAKQNQRRAMQLAAEIATLRKRINKLKAELARLQAKVAALERQVGAAKPVPDDRRDIQIGYSADDVRVRRLRPRFVECTENSITIHPSRKGGRTWRVSVADLDDAKAFRAVQDEVKRTRGGILIFLIRQDGVVTFDKARGDAYGRGVKTGKLPLPGQGRIDLSPFQKRFR